LRGLLVDGASSGQSDPADARYFTELRDRVRGRHGKWQTSPSSLGDWFAVTSKRP